MKKDNLITTGGLVPNPRQSSPATVIIQQPKRFNIDIQDFIEGIRAYENVDFPRRFRLFDLYEDILIDSHLQSVVQKRHDAINAVPIAFKRDGNDDEEIGNQIEAPWFGDLINDILDAKFWGFSLMQFYRKDGWIGYDLIPRKNVEPVRREILHMQTDLMGTPWEQFSNLLFVGSERKLGELAKASPWVIYKRNSVADWAQFCEVFGIPMREYTYDEDDEESRQRAIDDASKQGGLAVFIHGKNTSMSLIDSSSKTASADLYERFAATANAEISKLILGNTLTTEQGKVGSQALGKVHSEEEDRKLQSDRRFILRVLNYEMTDIFASLGMNTKGGKFYFKVKREDNGTERMNLLVNAHNTFNLPISDDYLYESFGIDKPDDYESQKRELQKRNQERMAEQQQAGEPKPGARDSFMSRFRDFFAQAPHDGADSDVW